MLELFLDSYYLLIIKMDC